jgi:hypothetical protein
MYTLSSSVILLTAGFEYPELMVIDDGYSVSLAIAYPAKCGVTPL